MTPEEIRNHAVWLGDLTFDLYDPSDTSASELLHWAELVRDDRKFEYVLTEGDHRKLHNLIKALREEVPPEAHRAQQMRREKKLIERTLASLERFEGDQMAPIARDMLEGQLAALGKKEQFRSAGAAARRREGAPNRNAIISSYKALRMTPEREEPEKLLSVYTFCPNTFDAS